MSKHQISNRVLRLLVLNFCCSFSRGAILRGFDEWYKGSRQYHERFHFELFFCYQKEEVKVRNKPCQNTKFPNPVLRLLVLNFCFSFSRGAIFRGFDEQYKRSRQYHERFHFELFSWYRKKTKLPKNYVKKANSLIGF